VQVSKRPGHWGRAIRVRRPTCAAHCSGERSRPDARRTSTDRVPVFIRTCSSGAPREGVSSPQSFGHARPSAILSWTGRTTSQAVSGQLIGMASTAARVAGVEDLRGCAIGAPSDCLTSDSKLSCRSVRCSRWSERSQVRRMWPKRTTRPVRISSWGLVPGVMLKQREAVRETSVEQPSLISNTQSPLFSLDHFL